MKASERTTEQKMMLNYIEAAKDAGLCANQKEFCQLVGINKTQFSTSMNKGSVTRTLLRRAASELKAKGVDVERIKVVGNNNATANGNGATAKVVPDHTAELLSEMRAQRELYAKQVDAYIKQAEIQNQIILNLTQK